MARKTGTFLAVAALALGLAEPALGADEGDVAPAAQPPAPADPIGQVTQGVVAPVTQVVQDTVQQTTQATAPVTQVVQDTVQQTAAPVTQTVQNTVQQTTGAVTQTTDAVTRTTDAVGETARPVVDRTTDTVSRTVSPVADEVDREPVGRRDDSPAASGSDSSDTAVPPLRGGASSQREGEAPRTSTESSPAAPAPEASKPERESSATVRPETRRWFEPAPVEAVPEPGSDLAAGTRSPHSPDGGASTGTRPRRDASDGFSGNAGLGGSSVAGASAVSASAAASGPMLLLAFIGLCFGVACVMRRLQLVQITRSGDAFSLLLERPG